MRSGVPGTASSGRSSGRGYRRPVPRRGILDRFRTARFLLSSAAKRRMPAGTKDVVRAALDASDPLPRALHRVRSGDRDPLPPRSLRARAGEPKISRFVRVGQRTAASLDEALGVLGHTLEEMDAVLDFGCGCGRTLRHLYARAGSTLSGSDVDAEAVEWCRNTYPAARFEVNRSRPPLPFSDGSFDLVYSISIFTHLPEARQQEWLRELRRVLRPGGIALVSIQGQQALEIFQIGAMFVTRSCADALATTGPVDSERFVYLPYDDFQPDSSKYPGIEDSYGLTFQSADYVTETWSSSLEVLGVRSAAVDGLQDLVLMRKAASAEVTG
jgi:SAM-dependent methyltransferase